MVELYVCLLFEMYIPTESVFPGQEVLRQHETAAGQQRGFPPALEKSERSSRAAAGRPTPPAAPPSGAATEPADGEVRDGDAAAAQCSGSPGSWVLREELD